jgi:HTH-type transcriptional regulator/antitoxin HigA
MKISIPKEWLLERVHLEEGLEIGAGGPLEHQTPMLSIEWDRFPIKEMYKRNWFEGFTGSVSAAVTEAQTLVRGFMERAIRRPLVVLQRQRVRTGSEADPYALLAWQCRVLLLAKSAPAPREFRVGTIDDAWMKTLVQLSRFEDGPIRARKQLGEAGIVLVVEPHLSSTHLDGAALLGDNGPVIGLTLRQDRLDNFWFVLLHELAHIKKHLKKGSVEDIFDEASSATEGLIDGSGAAPDELEREADQLAGEALISTDAWNTALARFIQTEDSVKSFAAQMRISPAIVAGRIRREANNWTILGNLVGQGEIRRLFPDVRFGW